MKTRSPMHIKILVLEIRYLIIVSSDFKHLLELRNKVLKPRTPHILSLQVSAAEDG